MIRAERQTKFKHLNRKLIQKFRDQINDNHHYVLNKYRDVDGKNLWNVICSAMDWIEVAVDGIPYIQLKHQNQNVSSLNLMQLICAMDLIVESVQQLYRVFNQDYPYRNDKSIFKSEKTDDGYFKHIRAMFGVHPVNLKDDAHQRYFASWSIPHLKGDFSVFVYSNRTDKEHELYSITISDLFEYTNKRYNLLIELINKVQNDYEAHLESGKKRIIPVSNSITDQLTILMKENNGRIGQGEAYWYQLEELSRLFTVEDSIYHDEIRLIIVDYKRDLKKVVEEIRINLQDMNIQELSHYDILDPFDRVPYSYEKGKLLSYLHNPDSDFPARSIAEYALETMVEKGILPEMALHYDHAELLLLLNAWQWNQNKRKEYS